MYKDGRMNGEISTHLEGYVHALMYVCMRDWMMSLMNVWMERRMDE